MSMMRRLVALFALTCAQGAAAAECEWTVAPHKWVADANFNLDVAGGPGLGGGAEVPFSGFVDKIDAALRGSLTEADIVLSGPVLGFVFNF